MQKLLYPANPFVKKSLNTLIISFTALYFKLNVRIFGKRNSASGDPHFEEGEKNLQA
jgi:hypothetical protein